MKSLIFFAIYLAANVSADHPLAFVHSVHSVDSSEGNFDSISHAQESEFNANPSNPAFHTVDSNPNSVFPRNPVAGLVQTFQVLSNPAAFQQAQFNGFQQQQGAPFQTFQQLRQPAPLLTNSIDQTTSFSDSNDINHPPPVSGALETITSSAVKTPSLSTFVQALQAADFLDTFDGTERYTVFAPDNEAFEKLPPGTLDNLLRPENKNILRQILRRHVISGWVLNAFSIPEGNTEVLSFGTEPINLIKSNGAISVQSSEGGANVLFADGLATNGVVHMVDAVF